MEHLLQILAYAIVAVAVGAAILKAVWGGMSSDEGKSGGSGSNLQTECPNCGKAVTVSDEKMIGLWKDCPACQKQFKVAHLRRVSTKASSSADDAVTTETIISICVGLVAAIAIALSGHGSALLVTDVAVAAGFVFHLTGLGKMDGRHTNQLRFAAAIYSLGYMIAILIAFTVFRTTAANVAGMVLLVILCTAGGSGFKHRQAARSTCYMLFWSWVVFFGARVYNPQLLARPVGNPPVAGDEQQPQKELGKVVAPVVRTADQARPLDENKNAPKPAQRRKAETQQEKDESELELLTNELAKSTESSPKARDLVLRVLEPLSPEEARRRNRGSVCARAQILPQLPRLGLTVEESRRHVRRLLQDGDERVAMAAPDALVKLSQDQTDVTEDVIALLNVWKSGSVEYREAARNAVIELAPRDQSHLFAALKSEDVALRIQAGEVLGLLGSRQNLDLSEALKYRDDELAAPFALEAAIRLKPFPKEGLPLVVTGLRGKPALANTVGEILKKSSAEDLKPLVRDLSSLVDHPDLYVHRAALDGLSSAGAHAIPFLAERLRNARPDQSRDFIYATTFQSACTLVNSSDKEIISFFVESVADDDESKASQAVANSSVAALMRLAKDDPSVVSTSKLVASFTGKSDVSPGAVRVQHILRSMNEAAIKELIRGTESTDESVCVWSLRTVPLVPEFYSNGLVIDQANEFAKLAFEGRSERVRQAGYSLLHQFPSFQLPQSTIPIIRKYVNSKDVQKQGWAVTLSGKIATGPAKSPKTKKK